MGLLAGCNAPIPAFQDPHTALQVSIRDYGLQWKLRVQPPQTERVPGSGQLKVTLPVYNTTGDDMSIDYHAEFTDKNGVKIDDPASAGSKGEVIPARGYQNLTFTSMSPAAENFHVYLQPGNR